MGVDKETAPTYLSVWMPDNQSFLKAMREEWLSNGPPDKDEEKKMVLCSMDTGSLDCDEYYFEEGNNELNVSGTMRTANGDVSFTLAIPLSDTILIDIIQHSIKKLNKLKTAMEALK